MSRTPLVRRSADGPAALARSLGWFSLALGAVELIAPGAIKRQVGTPGPSTLIALYGLREVAAGVAILASDRPVAMVWSRVVGDLLDIATLVPAVMADRHRRAAAGAMAFVVAATAMDLAVAMQGDAQGPSRQRLTMG